MAALLMIDNKFCRPDYMYWTHAHMDFKMNAQLVSLASPILYWFCCWCLFFSSNVGEMYFRMLMLSSCCHRNAFALLFSVHIHMSMRLCRLRAICFTIRLSTANLLVSTTLSTTYSFQKCKRALSICFCIRIELYLNSNRSLNFIDSYSAKPNSL